MLILGSIDTFEIWKNWVLIRYPSYMFVHTLGLKKQSCNRIIEDCFVSQQHLMEEAPKSVYFFKVTLAHQNSNNCS